MKQPRKTRRGIYDTESAREIETALIYVPKRHERAARDIRAEREIAMSVARSGVRRPIAVRQAGKMYEVLSGIRRYRAAAAAGLKTVPCVVLDIDDEETEIYMLRERIVRRELGFIEEAAALDRLRHYYNITQSELSELVGLTQSTVANKLRLLKMPDHLRAAAKSGGLTERHCRAALRLPNPQLMARAVARMIADDMTVAEADEFVDQMGPEPDIPALRKATLPSALMGSQKSEVRGEKPEAGDRRAEAGSQKPDTERTSNMSTHFDYHFYYNTILRGAETMKKSGYSVNVDKNESGDEVLLTVAIGKKAEK